MQNGIDPQPAARSPRRRLLLGASAAGFVITLPIVIAAGLSPRPAVTSVSAGQPAPARPSAVARPLDSNPPTVEQTPLPKWLGRRQPGWAWDGTRTVSFELDAVTDATRSKLNVSHGP